MYTLLFIDCFLGVIPVSVPIVRIVKVMKTNLYAARIRDLVNFSSADTGAGNGGPDPPLNFSKYNVNSSFLC